MIKLITAFLLTTIFLSSCTGKKSTTKTGLTAQESLSTFQLPEGFKIELLASEPMISDPVAMEVDENGNIYVTGMADYALEYTPMTTIFPPLLVFDLLCFSRGSSPTTISPCYRYGFDLLLSSPSTIIFV